MLTKRVAKLMGNRFEISVIGPDENWGNSKIELAIQEIQRIEKLLTTFSEESVTSHINNNAGIQAVKVPVEVFELIERSQMISKITQGAFDLSYGSIDKKLWNFDTKMKVLPDEETAKKAVALINYKNIILDKEEQTVFS